jgi:coproporphyrinogen III oxidase
MEERKETIKSPNRDLVSAWFMDLQSSIIRQLEEADGHAVFSIENWNRPGGGGGITRLMTGGAVIEKGGVNFSAVFGETPAPVKASFRTEAEQFFATGVSIVIHPRNPFVPIIHMNVRYFELSDGQAWFGGGIDLTPAYVFPEDGKFFHTRLKSVCDQFGPDYYDLFKRQADDYFFIPHRNETRGIGGIFYDRFPANTPEKFQHLWAFTRAVGSLFAPTYVHLINQNRNKIWTEAHKNWQLHRRSRYVEFNLVYDAGTRFGLETNGRTESILMSMPPLARWETNYQPAEGTEEWKSQQYFKKGIQWV